MLSFAYLFMLRLSFRWTLFFTPGLAKRIVRLALSMKQKNLLHNISQYFLCECKEHSRVYGYSFYEVLFVKACVQECTAQHFTTFTAWIYRRAQYRIWLFISWGAMYECNSKMNYRRLIYWIEASAKNYNFASLIINRVHIVRHCYDIVNRRDSFKINQRLGYFWEIASCVDIQIICQLKINLSDL